MRHLGSTLGIPGLRTMPLFLLLRSLVKFRCPGFSGAAQMFSLFPYFLGKPAVLSRKDRAGSFIIEDLVEAELGSVPGFITYRL